MLSIRETIVVEGVYDKIKLKQMISSNVVVTNGFQIFRDKEMQKLLIRLSRETGVVILTDSDYAGFQIRNYLKNILDGGLIKHAYIPAIAGKEKRKAAPSSQGLLGVEGMTEQVLCNALRACGCEIEEEQKHITTAKEQILKKDFFALGLSGGEKSRERRATVLAKMNLPTHMPVNLMLDVCNVLFDKQSFYAFCREIAHELEK